MCGAMIGRAGPGPDSMSVWGDERGMFALGGHISRPARGRAPRVLGGGGGGGGRIVEIVETSATVETEGCEGGGGVLRTGRAVPAGAVGRRILAGMLRGGGASRSSDLKLLQVGRASRLAGSNRPQAQPPGRGTGRRVCARGVPGGGGGVGGRWPRQASRCGGAAERLGKGAAPAGGPPPEAIRVLALPLPGRDCRAGPRLLQRRGAAFHPGGVASLAAPAAIRVGRRVTAPARSSRRLPSPLPGPPARSDPDAARGVPSAATRSRVRFPRRRRPAVRLRGARLSRRGAPTFESAAQCARRTGGGPRGPLAGAAYEPGGYSHQRGNILPTPRRAGPTRGDVAAAGTGFSQ